MASIPPAGLCRFFFLLLLHSHSISSSLLLSSIELSDTQVFEPIRALLGTALHFCEVVLVGPRTVPNSAALSLRILRVTRCGGSLGRKQTGTNVQISHLRLEKGE